MLYRDNAGVLKLSEPKYTPQTGAAVVAESESKRFRTDIEGLRSSWSLVFISEFLAYPEGLLVSMCFLFCPVI